MDSASLLSRGPFGFRLETNVRFGVGVVRELPDYLLNRGARKIAVIVDAGAEKNPAAQSLLALIRESFPDAQVEQSDAVEPDYDYLDVFKARFTASLDAVVGIGGGSILDLAKAISVLVTNPGPAISYRGFDLVKNPGRPLIAIPTTAGTGSEVTPNAVFTDRAEMRKFGINTWEYVPELTYLDPEMTASCPRSVTISSGIDALVHTVESYVARGATPLSRVFAVQACPLILTSLAEVLDHPADLELRGRMQLGAFLAGCSLFNGGAGPAGALSYPLGVHYKVPHGIAGGVFLARVARGNVARGSTVYGELYDTLPDRDPSLTSLADKASAFCDRLDALCSRLQIPQSLTPFGVRRADVEIMTEQTMLLKGALDMNPAPFGKEEVRQLLLDMTEA